MAKKDSIESHVLAVLSGAGAVLDNIERSKHVKIKWSYRGQKRIVVLPNSASDFRAVKNAVAHVKRDMREIDGA